MRLIRNLDGTQISHQASVVTIGNFDGIHRGHQKLLDQLKSISNKLNCLSCVISFYPLPYAFFNPDQSVQIQSVREKIDQLNERGIDQLCLLRFNQPMAQMSAEAFIERYLIASLQAKHVLIGDDFRFGHQRLGDFSLLKKYEQQNQFTVSSLPTQFDSARRISSTAIRKALKNNLFNRAEDLLGRRYCISGKIIYGKQLGRTLGFPTINIALRRRKPIIHGVFAVSVEGIGPTAIKGVANLGTRPTVLGKDLILEVHLFDFSDTIYGRRVSVFFHEKLRNEEDYPNLADLKQQMTRDAQQARQLLTI